MNKSGSTPPHLAVQNTGKGNSGLEEAKEAQAQIIVFLLERGARPSDCDAKGKTVEAAASSEWIRELLHNHWPCRRTTAGRRRPQSGSSMP